MKIDNMTPFETQLKIMDQIMEGVTGEKNSYSKIFKPEIPEHDCKMDTHGYCETCEKYGNSH